MSINWQTQFVDPQYVALGKTARITPHTISAWVNQRSGDGT